MRREVYETMYRLSKGLKTASLKQVSYHSIINGGVAYLGLKALGAPEYISVAGFVLSALTGGVSAAADTKGDADDKTA